MRRRDFVTLIPLGAVWAACSGSSTGSNGNPPPPPPPPPPPAPAGGIGANMTIVDNAFVDPSGRRNGSASVTINAGQAVRWRNDGQSQHTVTSTSTPAGAAGFNSGDIEYQNFYDHTFSVAGTYTYRCENHPQEMLGATVIVQ